MEFRRASGASVVFAALALASVPLLTACSSGDAPLIAGGATPTPDVSHQGTVCRAASDCAAVVCACGSRVVNARSCVEGTCPTAQRACAKACAVEGPTQDTTPTHAPDGGPAPVATDASVVPPTLTRGDPCVPVSVSTVQARVGAVASLVAAHKSVPASPSNGVVAVTRDGSGSPTRISYDSSNDPDDYVDTLSYDATDNLTYWYHDATGTLADVSENFSYDSSGLISYFRHAADGTVDDATNTFQYDSAGHLTYFRHDGDGTADDVSETFSYDSTGLLTYFRRDADGAANNTSERFQYDAMGRLTYWALTADGMSNAGTLSISYSSSGQTTHASGSRAQGAMVSTCR